MTIAILTGVSLIALNSMFMAISYYKNGALTSLTYAQSATNNVTSLPPLKLEPVAPVNGGAWNSTSSYNVSTAYLNYNDKDLGFSIPYPSDWTVDSKNSEHNTVVGFNSPDDNASIDVRVFPKGDYKSTKDAGDKMFKNSDDQTLLAYYRNSTTLLSGKPAFRAIYLTTSNPGLFGYVLGSTSTTSKAMMIGTLVPEKKSLYTLAYFANGENFDNYRPVIEKMIDSFKISGKGPIIQEDNSSSTGD